MKADWLLRSVLLILLGVVANADEPKPDLRVGARLGTSNTQGHGARLREVIEQVREAEKLYQNLETSIRISSQDVTNTIDPNDRVNLSKSEETCYTLQQDDLFLFKRREVRTYGPNEPLVNEEVAAFDGETTRIVVFDNCVNIFAGRHEPSRIYPPHAWCLRTLWASYPLSVYLQGTDAIKKHPKSFKSPVQRGRIFEVAKVEVSYDGDEALEGLDCVKLTSHHWYRETDSPQVVRLWLAPDRNYLCLKMTVSAGQGAQEMLRQETKAVEWVELRPGLWLPKKIEATDYFRLQNGGDPVVHRRQTLLVDKASTGSNYPPARFRDIKIPDGLPTYKLDQDGFVEGSAVRSATAPGGDPAELDRIVAEVKRQEDRYQRYEVESTMTYRALEARSFFGGSSVTSIEETERTVSRPGKLYSTSLSKWHSGAGYLASFGGRPTTQAATVSVTRNEGAWDGQWVRTFNWHTREGDLPSAPSFVALQKGGPKGLNAFRPHTAVFSDDRMRNRPLSDFLTAKYWDETNQYRYLVQYIEDETVNGLTCAKLRLGSLIGDEIEPKHQFFFLWLARDRNYLPVRAQHVELIWSDRIPTSDARVDDLREIAPGLWFPYHVVELAHDSWGGDGMGSGQVLINWRRERQVEKLDLELDAPDELFAPEAAAGTWVYVSDDASHRIGRFRPRDNGVPSLADGKFAVMAETARVDWHDQQDQKRRQAAQDALVGTPFPDFGDGTWLNGPPQTMKSLAGKVLLVEFWAEWAQSSEQDLKSLAAASPGLVADGVTVVAIHTAGSDPQDIRDFADEARLDCPVYVDRPEQGGSTRWGSLFDKLAVIVLPHAFVVDRQGTIVAHGPLDKMMAQARAKAAEK
ncbi:MAG TPA: TlpA disulfide reductase family protein [Pirellulales bacterium]|nr:TlpA disulfide reductase family protein [Pirellulales bacterium]